MDDTYVLLGKLAPILESSLEGSSTDRLDDPAGAEGTRQDVPSAEVATVKPEGSAWIDSDTLLETVFHWEDLVPDDDQIE